MQQKILNLIHRTRHATGQRILGKVVETDEVRSFIAENNAPALKELSARFREAIDRGLWTPRSNSAYHHLRQFSGETIEEPA